MENSVYDNLMKKSLSSEIAWGKYLPEFVFARTSPIRFFFLDNGIVSTQGLLETLVEFNSLLFRDRILVSIGNNRATGEISNALLFLLEEESEISRLRATWVSRSHEWIDKVTLVGNERRDWVLFDDGLEDVAVLAIFTDASMSESFNEALDLLANFTFTTNEISQALKGDKSSNHLLGLFSRDFLEHLIGRYSNATNGK